MVSVSEKQRKPFLCDNKYSCHHANAVEDSTQLSISWAELKNGQILESVTQNGMTMNKTH